MNNANGSVFKYPDNVDTDVIIPARHLNTQDARELASHCMEDIDKDFINNVKDGDIMVGGWNFGCGSSREHAPLAIKTAGISVVIAKSFARIFYRNSINIGLPIMECPEAVDAIEQAVNRMQETSIQVKVVTEHLPQGRWLEVSSSRVDAAASGQDCMVCVIHDIDGRKRREIESARKQELDPATSAYRFEPGMDAITAARAGEAAAKLAAIEIAG